MGSSWKEVALRSLGRNSLRVSHLNITRLGICLSEPEFVSMVTTFFWWMLMNTRSTTWRRMQMRWSRLLLISVISQDCDLSIYFSELFIPFPHPKFTAQCSLSSHGFRRCQRGVHASLATLYCPLPFPFSESTQTALGVVTRDIPSWGWLWTSCPWADLTLAVPTDAVSFHNFLWQ